MTSQVPTKATTTKEWLTMRREARHGSPRCTGVSSDAMVFYALGGPYPADYEYPHDRSDYKACESIFSMAPAHLQRKLGGVMMEYRRALREKGVEL